MRFEDYLSIQWKITLEIGRALLWLGKRASRPLCKAVPSEYATVESLSTCCLTGRGPPPVDCGQTVRRGRLCWHIIAHWRTGASDVTPSAMASRAWLATGSIALCQPVRNKLGFEGSKVLRPFGCDPVSMRSKTTNTLSECRSGAAFTGVICLLSAFRPRSLSKRQSRALTDHRCHGGAAAYADSVFRISDRRLS